MLELQNISLAISDDPETRPLLDRINLQFDRGHFVAILGPSGCGKTTLVKSIAGIKEPTDGNIRWLGRDLANDRDLDPHEVGYIPQFSIAHDYLTVRESVNNALQLRVAGLSAEYREERVDQILREVGLSEIGDRLVRVLSGGQKRRIALALEIVTSPSLLLADEVTSGLDPKSEDDLVRLMRRFARDQYCIVLSITHSLRHIDLYDSVVILHEGCLAYHGPGHLIAHYFNLPDLEDLFPQLANREPEEWHRSWLKHQAFYLDQIPHILPPTIRKTSHDTTKLPAPQIVVNAERAEHANREPNDNLLADAIANDELADEKPPVISDDEPGSRALPRTPGPLAQFFVLLARRWKIFFRDRSQIVLQLALIIGFPCLVVIFALHGLPQIKNLSLAGGGHNIVNQVLQTARTLQQNSQTGSIVSGLIMFQVILLTLIASNNSAREIAAERLIFEKEKFAGLHPSAYVASKAAFLAILVLVQSLWMGVFVNIICRFPGDLLQQLAILVAVNAAMTSVCLGISSLSRTTEQASLISIYLVGFQLPLSGVVLALPDFVQWFSRLTIASYWGWSGFLKTMTDTRIYDSVGPILQTKLSELPACYWVLICHTIIGLCLAYVGCKSSKWE